MRSACMNFVSFFPGVTDHSYHNESDSIVIHGEHKVFGDEEAGYTVTIVPDIKKLHDYTEHLEKEHDDVRLEPLGYDCDDGYQGYRYICDRGGRVENFTFSSVDELQSLIGMTIKGYGAHRMLQNLEIGSDYDEYHKRAEAFFYDIIEGFKVEDGYKVVSVDSMFYKFKVYKQETDLTFDMCVMTRQQSAADEGEPWATHYVLTPYVYGRAETGVVFIPGSHVLKTVYICNRDEIHAVMEDARNREF